MSSNNKLLSGPVKDERLEMSAASDARKSFNRYKHLLTDEEKAWYENFMKGYFRGDEDALKAICPDVKKRRALLEERSYMAHANERYTPSPSTRRSGYSESDYTPAETSPEDALIDWIDTAHAKKDS